MKTMCQGVSRENRIEQRTAAVLAAVAERVATAMSEAVHKFTSSAQENLGHLEAKVTALAQQLVREALAQGAQRKADATPPTCPKCGRALKRQSDGQGRTFTTRAGEITVRRTRGYCPKCRKWRVAADAALGLADTAGYSPSVQEMGALLVSKMPVSEASLVLEHLVGLKVPPATLDREARRQGGRAQAVRKELDQRPIAPARPAGQLELPLEPYQMILQIDAWNIRERDAWGQSAQCRRRGDEPERWHWVYTGTCFRLDHRGQTAGGRPVITERGFVATRGGIDALREQLHAEARRRGLGQAAGALVIADGAVWIWRLADDRFPAARQRLDFYHAVQHLAAVGQALYGEDQAKLQAWLQPLVRQLKNESAVKVVRALEDALAALPAGAARAKVQTEVDYFHTHQARLDYRNARRRGEPIGSGAIEATCRQYQCRFKRTGQFWSENGDESLLCLDTFWRNGRWSLLFPHTLPPDPARN
jgi:hypothetical protein